MLTRHLLSQLQSPSAASAQEDALGSREMVAVEKDRAWQDPAA